MIYIQLQLEESIYIYIYIYKEFRKFVTIYIVIAAFVFSVDKLNESRNVKQGT